MKLYYYPGACSLAPHIALREGGCAFELVKTDILSKQTGEGGDFLAVNPKGYVPALMLDDGDVVTEVVAVLLYLADLNPAAGLAPANGTRERIRLVEWLSFVTAELHKGFGPLFKPELTAEARKAALGSLSSRLDYLDSHLIGRHYLLGDAFSIADAYAFTIINWSGLFAVDLSHWPAIQAFQARVSERPSVRAAMQAEGLLDAA